jgi:hypothetical protein
VLREIRRNVGETGGNADGIRAGIQTVDFTTTSDNSQSVRSVPP